MKNILTRLIFLFSLVYLPLCFFSCKKHDVLPPLTSEGNNTFGCLVNGKLWLPKGALMQGGTLAEVTVRNDHAGASIYADNVDRNSGITLSFYDRPALVIGKPYDLTDSTFLIEYTDWDGEINCFYGDVINGQLKLSKFDPDNKVVSGTFEFTAYSSECGDTVRVTDGRFDIGELIR